MPNTLEQTIVLEGLLGPLIEEVTIEEANNLGILSGVELRIIPIPKCNNILNLTKYQDIYQVGIVEYDLRNKIIANEVVNLVEEERTVLVFINKIEHGERIYDILAKTNISLAFVKGDVSGEERERLKKKIDRKDIDAVIASSVWTEGVNIPSLGAIVLAGIGKSEIRLVQSIGRGLRHVDGKISCIVVDFCDLGKYISEHFCHRLSIYKERNWI
jgi:superfamily II DNA or RNA helicase